MEEKKFDPYQFIGFVLIAVILTWMLYRNGPDEEATPVQVTTEQGTTAASTPEVVQVSDSILQQQKVEAFGDLGTLFVPKAIENVKIQTDNFSVEVQSKGGQIALFQLDEFENFEDAPIRLIDQSNADFNIMMTTLDGRIMNTREMYFLPTLSDSGDAYHLVMKASLSASQYVAFEYHFPKTGYLHTVTLKTEGMQRLLNSTTPPQLDWKTNTFRNSISIDYENRYTEFTFGYEEDRVDYLSMNGEDKETREGIRWISYRQHFFSAILIPDTPIPSAALTSVNLASDESLEEKFTKSFETAYPLVLSSGNLNTNLSFYFGPTDYKTLQNLEGDLETSIPMGWGIFGWINKFIFLPLLEFLSSFLSYGIAIIVMTLIVRDRKSVV